MAPCVSYVRTQATAIDHLLCIMDDERVNCNVDLVIFGAPIYSRDIYHKGNSGSRARSKQCGIRRVDTALRVSMSSAFTNVEKCMR